MLSKLFTQSAKLKSVWTWIILHFFHTKCFQWAHFPKSMNSFLIHTPPPAEHFTFKTEREQKKVTSLSETCMKCFGGLSEFWRWDYLFGLQGNKLIIINDTNVLKKISFHFILASRETFGGKCSHSALNSVFTIWIIFYLSESRNTLPQCRNTLLQVKVLHSNSYWSKSTNISIKIS